MAKLTDAKDGASRAETTAPSWLPERTRRWLGPLLRIPALTPWRVAPAFAVAVSVDAAQLLLGPIGFAFADEALDVVAMVATSWLIGFHVLLLPTFLIEIIPLADMLPTWTGCVGIVVARRRNAVSRPAEAPESRPHAPR